MATAETLSAPESVEAVIISGPLKGQFIRIPAQDVSGDIARLDNAELVITPDEEQALVVLERQIERTAEHLEQCVAKARGLREEFQTIIRSLDRGLSRTNHGRESRRIDAGRKGSAT
jgi:hypothetical protein